MKPAQAIGYVLLNTTSISAIVGTKVDHGLRPVGTAVPCINYYELGGVSRFNSVESVQYSINCRAASAGASRDLARLVLDLFTSSSGNGINGYISAGTVLFEISRASLVNDGGLIPEPEDGIYNSPIDVRIVYPVSTVS